jgi:putative ABC transport system permease protein
VRFWAVSRTDGVLASSATAALPGLHIYRNDRMGTHRHGGLTVRATDTALMSTLDEQLQAGVFRPVLALAYRSTTWPPVVLFRRRGLRRRSSPQ